MNDNINNPRRYYNNSSSDRNNSNSNDFIDSINNKIEHNYDFNNQPKNKIDDQQTKISQDQVQQHKKNQTVNKSTDNQNNHSNIIWKITGCFVIIIIILIISFLLLYKGVSNFIDEKDNDNHDDTSTHIDKKEPSDSRDKRDSTNKIDEQERQNSDSNIYPAGRKTITLNPGKYKAGSDIPFGRYLVSSKNRGNLFINEGNHAFRVNEIVGSAENDLIAQIDNNQEIEILSAKDVQFKPIEDQFYKDELISGIYIVGKHIDKGTYIINATDDNLVTIYVYSKVNGDYNIKDTALLNPKKGEKEVEIELEEDNILNIQNAISVKMKKK